MRPLASRVQYRPRMKTPLSPIRQWSFAIAVLAVLAIAFSPLTTIAWDGGESQPIEWRRTVRGWETTQGWFPPSPPHARIHPVTLGTLQILLSLGGLALFTWDGEIPGPTAQSRRVLRIERS